MYLIIIEGTDNIGKDTLKNQLIDFFETTTIIHCSGPKNTILSAYKQDQKFIEYANNIILGVYNGTDVIIMNRSHYGEYVYGQLYRGRSPIKIWEMIKTVDNILQSSNNLQIKYIQLLSTSNKLRKKYDDNKSLSKTEDAFMSKENDLFLEIYKESKFDKHLIYVNEGDEFKNKKDILDECLKFINE